MLQKICGLLTAQLHHRVVQTTRRDALTDEAVATLLFSAFSVAFPRLIHVFKRQLPVCMQLPGAGVRGNSGWVKIEAMA